MSQPLLVHELGAKCDILHKERGNELMIEKGQYVIHSLRRVSDSAGTPRGVIIGHQALIQSALASRDAFGVGSH